MAELGLVIYACGSGSIACRHFVTLSSQMLSKQRKAAHMPVVLGAKDRRLDKNTLHALYRRLLFFTAMVVTHSIRRRHDRLV
jgi:hypothetical protein